MKRWLNLADIVLFAFCVAAACAITALLLPQYYALLAGTLSDGIWSLFLGACFYICAHVFRFLRLLVLSVEHRPSLPSIIGLYSVTSFLSLCFPFKTGELFKVYEFSRYFRSFGTGLAIIAVERFFDALSLILLITLARFYYGDNQVQLSVLLPVLSIFVIFIILTYLFLPRSFAYLRSLTLGISESRRGIVFLNVIGYTEMVYDLFCSIIRGRFLILSILSIGVWLCELVTIYQFILAPTSTYKNIIYSLIVAFENIFIASDFTGSPTREYLALVFIILVGLLIVPTLIYSFSRIKKALGAGPAGGAGRPYKLNAVQRYVTRSIR